MGTRLACGSGTDGSTTEDEDDDEEEDGEEGILLVSLRSSGCWMDLTALAAEMDPTVDLLAGPTPSSSSQSHLEAACETEEVWGPRKQRGIFDLTQN